MVIRSHRLALPGDAHLLDELTRVKLRETSPGSYRLGHAAAAPDNRAIAIAIGVHLLDQPQVTTARVGRWVAVGGHDACASYETLFPDPRHDPEERKHVYHERWCASRARRLAIDRDPHEPRIRGGR